MLLESSPALKQLGALLDRVTYIAACELLQSSSAVSALAWFPAGNGELDQNGKCIVGALLERQISSLEVSRWKQGVREVIQVLLDDALLVYDGEERPIRHARVLLKKMELGYYSGAHLSDTVERAGESAQVLLSRQVKSSVDTH